MQIKTITLQNAKADASSQNGSLTGYFSVFGNVDRANEMVVKGAFAQSIPDFLRTGYIAHNHNWDAAPIGMPLQAQEDDIGLLVTAEFHSTPEAQAIRRMVEERIAKGLDVKCSIGYAVKDAEYNSEGVRILKNVELYECSIVNTPANPRAALTAVKSLVSSGISLDDHNEAAQAILEEYALRVKELLSLRKKEGRTLSRRNIARIQSVVEILESLEKAKSLLIELIQENEEASAEKNSREKARKNNANDKNNNNSQDKNAAKLRLLALEAELSQFL